MKDNKEKRTIGKYMNKKIVNKHTKDKTRKKA